jgi:hypothetical protein
MTNRRISKGQLRQAILRLAQIEIPEEGKEISNQLRSILMDQKYTAVDFACSILQDDFEINLNNVLLQNREQINQITSDETNGPIDESKIMEIEKNIEDLLLLLEKYRLQQQMPDSVTTENAPSFQQLSQTVYVAQGQLEAESIRLFLQSFGILARVAQESAGVALGLTVGSLGEADVRVSPTDAQDAVQLLEAMKNGLFIFPEDMDSSDLDGQENGTD